MTLRDLHLASGALLAEDGIPLHYGDQRAEYDAALSHVVVMERSHEMRLLLSGRDAFALPNRISTNDLLTLQEGEGRPTLFTNPNGRILERATVYRQGDTALVLAEAGRGEALRAYLQRNTFFNDQLQVTVPDTALFTLHGVHADELVRTLLGDLPAHAGELLIDGQSVFIARRKPLVGAQWVVVAPLSPSPAVWQRLVGAGAVPAGSLVYNALRIRAGRPAAGRELTPDYIPLELGLWDEVSFTKGCYTGQEIIARMESRNRLARTIVQTALTAFVPAPAELYHEGRRVGTLTSSVMTPHGENLGIAVVRLAAARQGMLLTAHEQQVRVLALAGVQPLVQAEEE